MSSVSDNQQLRPVEQRTPAIPPVELLAPAGSWDAFRAVIAAGADAVYVGGKRFNMRLKRAVMHFDEEGLRDAIRYAHDRGVHIYVTVNNLLYEDELVALEHFLYDLASMGPDAIIVQDLAVVEIVRQQSLPLVLHASTMMNVHHLETVRILEAMGVRRIVTSRDIGLEEVASWRPHTAVEFEYFLHGDMCIAQSGQCLTSGLAAGESSNRGRCLKPCRWPYSLVDAATGEAVGGPGAQGHLLAMKDLALIQHLPHLVAAGITSLKIEGRMRPAEHLGPLVASYRAALDHYISDPMGYRWDTETWHRLAGQRVREFTTSFAMGHPGPAAVDISGIHEPEVMRSAVVEVELPVETSSNGGRPLPPQTLAMGKPRLTVRVGSLSAAREALAAGADRLLLGGEQPMDASEGWTWPKVVEAMDAARTAGRQVVICTPRITTRREILELRWLLNRLEAHRPDGVLGHTLAALRVVLKESTVPAMADFGLNLGNAEAIGILARLGVKEVTAALECSLERLCGLTDASPLPVEVFIHGPMTGMVLEHCLPAAYLHGVSPDQTCPAPCRERRFALKDAKDQVKPILCDQFCRNHVLMAHDLCGWPFLLDLWAAGVAGIRLEAHLYEPPLVGVLTRAYREALDQHEENNADPYTRDLRRWAVVKQLSPRPLGPGALVSRAAAEAAFIGARNE